MNEMALGLLSGQKNNPRTAELLANLKVENVLGDSLIARTPWLQEPDCFACHVDIQQPAPGARAFNKYNPTEKELYGNYNDNGRIKCVGCHSSTHAIYPALNSYDTFRDVLQPMQYEGLPFTIGANRNCYVCHTKDMDFPLHHANILREVRNKGGFEAHGY
jgi:hypothetical protein